MEPDTLLGLAALALVSYLLGTAPFGLIVSRAMGLGDPRQIGSGNIGATNVLRTGSKTAGGLTLLLDALKGLVPVLAGRAIFAEGGAELAGLSAFLGHLFPVWLRFRGGKGVATFFGVLFGLAWPLGLLTACIWIAAAWATRMSSAAALAASALAPVAGVFLAPAGAVSLLALLAILIWVRHRANISRIVAGREPKIGGAGKEAEP